MIQSTGRGTSKSALGGALFRLKDKAPVEYLVYQIHFHSKVPALFSTLTSLTHIPVWSQDKATA